LPAVCLLFACCLPAVFLLSACCFSADYRLVAAQAELRLHRTEGRHPIVDDAVPDDPNDESNDGSNEPHPASEPLAAEPPPGAAVQPDATRLHAL
jgi:hypothetical protein